MKTAKEFQDEVNAMLNDEVLMLALKDKVCFWPRKKPVEMPYTSKGQVALTAADYYQMSQTTNNLWKNKHGL